MSQHSMLSSIKQTTFFKSESTNETETKINRTFHYWILDFYVLLCNNTTAIFQSLHCVSERDKGLPHGHTIWPQLHKYSCMRWSCICQTLLPRCRLLWVALSVEVPLWHSGGNLLESRTKVMVWQSLKQSKM